MILDFFSFVMIIKIKLKTICFFHLSFVTITANVKKIKIYIIELF